ncbi:MAG: DinB family protein [Phycisphaerae bacterium]|nr:DinB family protein [Phycisphaerae bacterium]
MGQFGESLSQAGRMGVMYARTLLEGIPAERFARRAGGVDANHPAFILGHLGLYPARLAGMLAEAGGGNGLARVPAAPKGFEELFAAGRPCVDDATGTVYPPAVTLRDHYFAAMEALMGALPGVEDEVFGRPNPREGRIRDLLPTLGALSVFLVSGHVMTHLGQLSTWRRCAGLSAAAM